MGAPPGDLAPWKLPLHGRADNRRCWRAGPRVSCAVMQCDRCGTENVATRRFCRSCGAALAAACASCGFLNEADARFCGGCGAALRPAAPAPAQRERRQVAVLFMDLVGFTAMTAELGAEDTQAL